MDLSRIRETLASDEGKRAWRSLDEIAETPEFLELLHREFPENASEWSDPVGRRRFLQIMGASLALAGVTGCTRQPKETIWPYAKPPEEIVPGKPVFYATALSLGGYATGVLAESHLGRPTKIEGNPDHPASLGGTDVFCQAAILGLYDPDRSKNVLHIGEILTTSDFFAAVQGIVDSKKTVGGEGLRILTGTVTSPTLAAQLAKLLETFPKAVWHQWEPATRDPVRAGATLAFGEPVETVYRFDRADVIVAFDADVFTGLPGSVRYVKEITERRSPDAQAGMSRIYVAESTPSLTGGFADHRLPVRASEIDSLVRALAAEVGVPGASVPTTLEAETRSWIAAVARDLKAHSGSSVVVAGEGQPAAVHAVVHAINYILRNAGRTVLQIEPVEAAPTDQTESLRALVDDMNASRVTTLLILGGNPVYDAPSDLRFGDALQKVAIRIHLGLYNDETAAQCQWHVPEAHPLESWSDARAFDGSVSIVQPLVEPLYGGMTSHEVLAVLLGQPGRSSHDLVKEHWTARSGAGADFERFWRHALRDGVVASSALPEKSLVPAALPAPTPMGADEIEIVFRTDPNVFDGRFANNGWLQELPRPLTKLTWENAATIGPAMAERLGLANEDVVELAYRGAKVEAPVWILPGQPDRSVTVHLGYGRSRAGRVGDGAGFNAYALRTSDAPWFGSGLTVRKTGARHPLATTQSHHSMEGRQLARSATLEEFRRDPGFMSHVAHEPAPDETMYPPHAYEGHAWGMSIDLNACVGCNACVVACQAENNIPVVGKEQIARGREMHWIRIDRYYEGGLDDPETLHQPVMCMHCENAPCELVCPVAATVHSSEGLNDMVYNRCVGTRYCSNNCPYKVRRFNFLLYQDWNTPSLEMARNPDVTVRSRGVMEKCTYCVQRINEARNRAKIEDRPIADGEIVTACQQACPAGAIVFGDINDEASRVARSKSGARNYGLLAELNTRPRTSYLGSLRNPNPEIEKA